MDEPTAIVKDMTDLDGRPFHFGVTEEQAHTLLEAGPNEPVTLNGLREHAFYDDDDVFCYSLGEGEDGATTRSVDGVIVRRALADLIAENRTDPAWIS